MLAQHDLRPSSHQLCTTVMYKLSSCLLTYCTVEEQPDTALGSVESNDTCFDSLSLYVAQMLKCQLAAWKHIT
jgi:hypothetical protein